MYMYLDLFCDIPDILKYTWVYLQQFFNELIGGRLGLSQKFQTKQVFIVLIGLEGGSKHCRRKRKGNTRFIVSYVWLWREKKSFLSSIFHALIIFCSFPSLEAILPRQIASYILWSKLTLEPRMQEMYSKSIVNALHNTCVIKLKYIGLIL